MKGPFKYFNPILVKDSDEGSGGFRLKNSQCLRVQKGIAVSYVRQAIVYLL